MIKLVLIICIIILVVLYLRKDKENLFYDENTYQSLKTQEKILNNLQNQYDGTIPEDDKITNMTDCRANLLYDISKTL